MKKSGEKPCCINLENKCQVIITDDKKVSETEHRRLRYFPAKPPAEKNQRIWH